MPSDPALKTAAISWGSTPTSRSLTAIVAERSWTIAMIGFAPTAALIAITAPGATIALAGGVLAAGGLGLSSMLLWTLSRPEIAIPMYEKFVAICREKGYHVETGEFGAYMEVESLNDGPFTLIVDSADLDTPKKQ